MFIELIIMPNQKSIIAKMEESILKSTKPKYMDSLEEINQFLEDRLNKDAKPPKSIFKSINFNGMEVFTFGDKNAKNTILYMHGGAYVNEINWQHYLYCMLMSRKLGAYVLAPVYPLAPLHNVDETFVLITELYKKLISKGNITLMGDSAGGGFVLSFCQYIKTVDLPQPDHIVTFSPWVDISMSNSPYNSKDDPILGEVGLREIGKAWAGNLDVKDYRVSPIFGNNEGLAKTLIFAGDNEIFYKDIEKYVQNLKESGVDVRFIVGKGLFHIYPLFPIPEAKNAFKEMKKEIIG